MLFAMPLRPAAPCCFSLASRHIRYAAARVADYYFRFSLPTLLYAAAFFDAMREARERYAVFDAMPLLAARGAMSACLR